MGQIGSTIADAALMGPRYAARLASAIPSDRFARLSSPGQQIVDANHPAFALGHLCLYPIKVLQLLGLDTAEVTPPEGYEKLFSKDAQCVDDPKGDLYPSRDEIIGFFESSYAIAIEAVRNAEDAQLAAENPVDSPMKQILPSLGSMLAFYLTGHVMIHLGQLSTWRRMEGMPAA
jgi:hypothetical protein